MRALVLERALPSAPDQLVVLRDVSWSHFRTVLAIRGERATPRLSYLDGNLELMTPSRAHEGIGRMLVQLLVVYALERGLDLRAFGSWTIKMSRKRSGLEPDECFTLGPARDVPDLALEVVLTSGGIEKLEIYRRLGIPEVWIWEEGRLRVHVLGGERYRARRGSVLLRDLDLGLVERLLVREDQTAAVREFQEALRGGARRTRRRAARRRRP